MILGLQAPDEQVSCQIYNLGFGTGNKTKGQIGEFVVERKPETMVNYMGMTSSGDMGGITVSIEKNLRDLGFQTCLTSDDGIDEVQHVTCTSLIGNPSDQQIRNDQFTVQ